MNNRKPGEKFTEEAEPFVEQVKEMATKNYQKLLTLSHDLGQKLQKTFNPTFGIGGTGSSTKTNRQNLENIKPIKKNDDEGHDSQDDS